MKSAFCFLIIVASSKQIFTISRAIKNYYNGIDDLRRDQGKVEFSTEKCISTFGCNIAWHYCDNGTCACGPSPPHDVLQCDGSKSLNVSSRQCVTFDQTSNSTYFGHCPFALGHTTFPYIPHELEDVMCGKHFNRTGSAKMATIPLLIPLI